MVQEMEFRGKTTYPRLQNTHFQNELSLGNVVNKRAKDLCLLRTLMQIFRVLFQENCKKLKALLSNNNISGC